MVIVVLFRHSACRRCCALLRLTSVQNSNASFQGFYGLTPMRTVAYGFNHRDALVRFILLACVITLIATL